MNMSPTPGCPLKLRYVLYSSKIRPAVSSTRCPFLVTSVRALMHADMHSSGRRSSLSTGREASLATIATFVSTTTGFMRLFALLDHSQKQLVCGGSFLTAERHPSSGHQRSLLA